MVYHSTRVVGPKVTVGAILKMWMALLPCLKVSVDLNGRDVSESYRNSVTAWLSSSKTNTYFSSGRVLESLRLYSVTGSSTVGVLTQTSSQKMSILKTPIFRSVP